jgi:hypothetical protein
MVIKYKIIIKPMALRVLVVDRLETKTRFSPSPPINRVFTLKEVL